MIIAVPRERKVAERRVALTPEGASRLIQQGHQVLVERRAGELSGYSDEAYIACGVNVINSLEELWGQAELLVKVKEPAPEEFSLMREGLAVFSFLHLAVMPELVQALLEHKVIGLDYDLLSTAPGRFPILEPMSAIAGKLSAQAGAWALQAEHGGKGVLLGGTEGVKPARAVVLGVGIAGANAARVLYGMGAKVTLIDINQERLNKLALELPGAETCISSLENLKTCLETADLVIGAALIPGAKTPKLITHELLSVMKAGSVIVDISIDQGGIAQTSRATTIEKPTYIEQGIVHYCVPNMPALVPSTSTNALTSASLPWIEELANAGIKNALLTSEPLRRSLTTYNGWLTNEPIGKALGMKYVTVDEALRETK